MFRVGSLGASGRLSWANLLVAGSCLLAAVSSASGVRRVQAQERKQLFVSVMETNGVPVLDLKASDVKVFENQVPATIASVEPVDWPMKLTVLIDNGPKSSDYLAALRTGLRNFLNEIPDGVEVSIVSLAPQPRWVLRPTTDLDTELKSVDLLVPDSGAAKFFDGLMEASARIEKDRSNYFPVFLHGHKRPRRRRHAARPRLAASQEAGQRLRDHCSLRDSDDWIPVGP